MKQFAIPNPNVGATFTVALNSNMNKHGANTAIKNATHNNRRGRPACLPVCGDCSHVCDGYSHVCNDYPPVRNDTRNANIVAKRADTQVCPYRANTATINANKHRKNANITAQGRP